MARDRWENIRESFREDWSKKFGSWPLERGKSWPGHHIRDLKHGGDPVDPNNILPTPPTIHDVLNKEYPRCYDGGHPGIRLEAALRARRPAYWLKRSAPGNT